MGRQRLGGDDEPPVGGPAGAQPHPAAGGEDHHGRGELDPLGDLDRGRPAAVGGDVGQRALGGLAGALGAQPAPVHDLHPAGAQHGR